jgi:small subunit ribosomal protein S8
MHKSLNNLISELKRGLGINALFIQVPHFCKCELFLEVLIEEGFIISYRVCVVKKKKIVYVYLKYINNGSVIRKIRMLSKKNLPFYVSVGDLWKAKPNTGVLLISTSAFGIIPHKKALYHNVGGEVLFQVE